VSSSPPPTIEPPVDRAQLEAYPSQVLKDEGPGAPRVVRYELPDGPVVLKEWVVEQRVMGWWARQIMRREIAHYRLLTGLRGIPAFRGAYGRQAFLMEWVDAVPLKRRIGRPMMRRALDDLEVVLGELHARRFVHLDLHQRLNTMVGPEGRVWLIDLGQGVDCRAFPARLLFPLLANIDRRAVLKFRARYIPDTIDEALRDKAVRRYGGDRGGSPFKRFHRWVRSLLTRDAS